MNIQKQQEMNEEQGDEENVHNGQRQAHGPLPFYRLLPYSANQASAILHLVVLYIWNIHTDRSTMVTVYVCVREKEREAKIGPWAFAFQQLVAIFSANQASAILQLVVLTYMEYTYRQMYNGYSLYEREREREGTLDASNK